MIRTYPSKSIHTRLTTTATVVLAAFLALLPAFAQDDSAAAKQKAASAMQQWLTEIDAGDYLKSWDDASSFFQKALPSAKWVSALDTVRTPLGKLISRTPVSSLYQASVPHGNGTPLPGPFIVAQFNSSFENLKYAVETVTFQKDQDGTWKASGYYIKPGQ
jgi:hypothetical protein